MQDDFAALFAAADNARRHGDPAAAIAALERIIALAPANARALNALAALVQRQGDTVRALSLFARATAADPSAPELWLNRAAAHRLADDSDGELAALDAALIADPYCLPALLQRGRAAELSGARRQAARSFGAALDVIGTATELPPSLAAAVEHARRFVADDKAALAARIAAEITHVRAATDDEAAARFDHCLGVLTGQRRHYPSTPTGLAFPGLPVIEYLPRASMPWLAQLEAGADAARREFLDLVDADSPGFRPYVDYAPGTPVNQWGALNGSPDWSAFFLWKDGHKQLDNCARCPKTAALLDTLPMLDLAGRGPSAFFSVLRPGAVIPPHVGVTNIRSVVHLALVVPPNCGLRVGSATRQWVEGTAFTFDDTIEHEAWNHSDRLRAVLILDIWNPALTAVERNLLRHLTAGMDAHAMAAA